MKTKHGPKAPQSALVMQVGLHMAPPDGIGKYWMPAPMPAFAGSAKNCLSAPVTAVHRVPPPATVSDIDPDLSSMKKMSVCTRFACVVSAAHAHAPSMHGEP